MKIGAAKEKQMFQQWVQLEKKEWENLNNPSYQGRSNGIASDEMSSIWRSDLYEKCKKRSKIIHIYLFTFFKTNRVNITF